MLYDILDRLEAQSGPVLIADLSQQMNVPSAVVRDMLRFWQRKGRVQFDGEELQVSAVACPHCVSTSHCALPVQGPSSAVISLKDPLR